MVIVIVIKYSPTSMDHPHPHPLHLLTKEGSHECLSQADSACSTLSPTAAALMEHHMMENNLDQMEHNILRHNGFHEEIYGAQVDNTIYMKSPSVKHCVCCQVNLSPVVDLRSTFLR